jgi:hypothetical protein
MELTRDQKQQIREYLEQQGLSFKPLQDEMVDHLSCDLELRMREGYSFDKAWHQVTGDIGDNHFQHIQTEIMETINKRFTWSQGLSFLALGLLLISMVFKVLHLYPAGELLILSFVFIAASLLTTSLNGVFLNRGKQGGARVLSMIAGIIVLLIGYAFKVLHMPGGDELILLAVSVLIISLLVNTIHVYRNASGHSNLLTYLHEKYTPGIERFFLILLLPTLVYKGVMILLGADASAGNFILLVVMFGSGLQVIAMCWRIMEKDLHKRNPFTLAATITSSVCLTLPFLGQLVPFEARVAIIILFTTVSGWLAYTMEEEPRRFTSLILVCLVPLIFIGWALIRLDVIAASSHSIFFNIPVIVILGTGLLLCRKHGVMRAYMLISLASYLFEYIA